jgi:hypothetical protein
MSNFFKAYKDKEFKGDFIDLEIDYYQNDKIYSLEGSKIYDEMSSIKWDIPTGAEVFIYEESDGSGRFYSMTGKGEDSDTHSNNTSEHDFKDCSKYFMITGNPGAMSDGLKFTEITADDTYDMTYVEDGNELPSWGAWPFPSGHFQGIQQFDNRRIILSGSSSEYAFFITVRWNEGFGSEDKPKEGKIKTVINITQDVNDNVDTLFPNQKDYKMVHQHAGGFQTLDNVLAVATEGNDDEYASLVLFYDITDPQNPKIIDNVVIERPDAGDTGGTVGITSYKDGYLVVVGNGDAKKLDFYTSDTKDWKAGMFTKLKSWEEGDKDTSHWMSDSYPSYQNQNLFTDDSGEIYMISMASTGGIDGWLGNDWADLFHVDLNAANDSKILRKIECKHFKCDAGDFIKGSGVYVDPETNDLSLWATHGTNYKVNRFTS